MGLRLIHTEGKNAGAMAKVYRDNDWQEYRVKFYRDGVYEGEASDHHTDDKGDAVATAQLWVKRPRIGNPGHANERASNPEKGPGGSTIQTQAEVNEFVRKMNETTLFAAGAYGRTPKIKDWQNGKDFVALDPPKWVGGRYFSIRDVETIYNLGYRKIVFGGHEGFDVELVMQ